MWPRGERLDQSRRTTHGHDRQNKVFMFACALRVIGGMHAKTSIRGLLTRGVRPSYARLLHNFCTMCATAVPHDCLCTLMRSETSLTHGSR
jgi:hypothetical protein